MDIPTLLLTPEQFEELPISEDPSYDQPTCRHKCGTGQWLMISPSLATKVAVIEIREEGEITKIFKDRDRQIRKQKGQFLKALFRKRREKSKPKGPRHTPKKR